MGTALKVLVISQLPPPVHGSSIMTALLVEQLSAEGADVRVVERTFSRHIAEIGRFSFRKVASAFLLLFKTAMGLIRFRPDRVIFFATNRSFSFFVDCGLLELMRLSRVEVIGYLHTSGWSSLSARNRVVRFMVKRLLGGCQTLVVLGDAAQQDLAGLKSSTSQITIIPNAVEDPGLRLRSSSSLSVLFLGNFIEEKGIGDFIELSRLCAGSDIGFTAAGAALSEHQLSKLRAEAGDSAQICSGVYGDAKTELLRSTDVLVMPSKYRFEAQPLVILEALSHGIPVVAYDTGGIRDIVRAAAGGTLVPVGRVDLLAQAVESLLNQDHRSAMSHRARLAYEQRYSVQSYRNRWKDLLWPSAS